MPVDSITLRDFRGYGAATAALAPRVTVVVGPNGAGKTNLLEAVYFACTGRSCRTTNDRELVRFGAATTRVVLDTTTDDGSHRFTVGFTPGEAKRMTADGAPVERLVDVDHRPLVSVFLPDRLEIVKGSPALRRAHLDQFVAALWPGRAGHRRAYTLALAQRNALLGRVRGGQTSRTALAPWNAELARHGLALMAGRREAAELAVEPFQGIAARLGLDGSPSLRYRPRSSAGRVEDFVGELENRLEGDLERGFTGYGPHRDDLVLSRDSRELRTFGSQGQQRLGLLALLLAERVAVAHLRGAPPLLLLDDVMSELDATRRAALVEVVAEGGGQALFTTTDADQVPLPPNAVDVGWLRVTAGQVIPDPQCATDRMEAA